MAADNPDASPNASEIRELRRLIADGQRSGLAAHPLAVTFSGVFAAGFLALFGWMAFQTHANSAAIAVLQTDVARLQADVKKLQAGQEVLKAGQADLKAGQTELRAGLRELKALVLEQRRR